MQPPAIASQQNPDGGWPQRSGGSWTEPTAYALLAQLIAGQAPENLDRGLAWLRRNQRPDGGWGPRPAVGATTWVTAVVALLPPELIGADRHHKAIAWLVEQTGQESSRLYRLRNFLTTGSVFEPAAHAGWPWFPETASWTAPTAISILSLKKACARRPDPDIQKRIDEGCQFLLDRRCSDGGWNHGSSEALGYQMDSYPDTTGMALLALRGVPADLEKSLKRAKEHLARCRSVEGISWLQLGLRAHGEGRVESQAAYPCRTVSESAISVLAQAAAGGRNIFFE
jgi:hypothetical protein